MKTKLITVALAERWLSQALNFIPAISMGGFVWMPSNVARSRDISRSSSTD
jgi:hypothetical protein